MGGEIDLGRVVLTAQQNLVVHLRATAGVDLTRFQAWAGGDALAPRLFSKEGAVRYEHVDAGYYELMLVHPDHSIEVKDAWLRAGEHWSETFEAGGTADLGVRIKGDLPEESSMPLRLELAPSNGSSKRQLDVPTITGEQRLEQLATGQAELCVTAGDGSLLARRTVELAPGNNQVELEIGGPPMLVLVLDARGDPVRGATVKLTTSGEAGVFLGKTFTDAGGVCRYRGVGEGGTALLATVIHDTGIVSGVPLEVLRDLGDPALIRFEPNASIPLRVMDGEHPQEGVVVELYDGFDPGGFLANSSASDADGMIRWEHLGAGSYRGLVHQDPRYWRGEALLEARHDPLVTTLQLRRRADLRLRVQTAAGLPLPDISIIVESLELGRAIADWAPGGYVDVDPSSVRTDGNGELSLSRIPRGRYRWSVTFGSGTSQTGEVDVPGWEETSVLIEHSY